MWAGCSNNEANAFFFIFHLQAIAWMYDKQLVHALFENAASRYEDRNGGYTRVLRTMPRQGDNSKMAIVELV